VGKDLHSIPILKLIWPISTQMTRVEMTLVDPKSYITCPLQTLVTPNLFQAGDCSWLVILRLGSLDLNAVQASGKPCSRHRQSYPRSSSRLGLLRCTRAGIQTGRQAGMQTSKQTDWHTNEWKGKQAVTQTQRQMGDMRDHRSTVHTAPC